MIVYVVLEEEFLRAIFSTKEKADEYIQSRMCPAMYRAYPFKVDKDRWEYRFTTGT